MRSFFMGAMITVAVTVLNSAAAKKEAEPYKVDAFTSASRKLNVDSGWVYRDKAVLYWVEYYECDFDVAAYFIRWGTQPGVFTDTLKLLDREQVPELYYAHQTTNAATITGLAENTAYYAQFYRDYKYKGYITDFRFNTPPLPRYNVIHPRPLRLRSAEAVTGVDLYSINGRLLRHIAVDRSTDLSNIWSSLRLSGLYVVKYSGDSRVIGSEKILFGN